MYVVHHPAWPLLLLCLCCCHCYLLTCLQSSQDEHPATCLLMPMAAELTPVCPNRSANSFSSVRAIILRAMALRSRAVSMSWLVDCRSVPY
jgi:hypothetical protein